MEAGQEATAGLKEAQPGIGVEVEGETLGQWAAFLALAVVALLPVIYKKIFRRKAAQIEEAAQ